MSVFSSGNMNYKFESIMKVVINQDNTVMQRKENLSQIEFSNACQCDKVVVDIPVCHRHGVRCRGWVRARSRARPRRSSRGDQGQLTLPRQHHRQTPLYNEAPTSWQKPMQHPLPDDMKRG